MQNIGGSNNGLHGNGSQGYNGKSMQMLEMGFARGAGGNNISSGTT